MSEDLPAPVTVNDLLLRGVYDQIAATNDLLRRVLDRLPEREPAAGSRPEGTVELREPETPSTKPRVGAGKPAGTSGGARPTPRRKPAPKKE